MQFKECPRTIQTSLFQMRTTHFYSKLLNIILLKKLMYLYKFKYEQIVSEYNSSLYIMVIMIHYGITFKDI